MNYSDGLKCAVCVSRSLKNKDISNVTPVQDGVDGAKAAVVVVDGKSMCAEHYHEVLTYMTVADYLKATENLGVR